MVDSYSTSGKSPAFQFYPKDYLADANTRRMTFQQRGMYWDLCCHCWLDGLPADPAEIALTIGITKPARFISSDWPLLSRCFRPDPANTNRLIHPRLEREREAQRVWRAKSSAGGRRSAAKRKGGSTTLTTTLQPDGSQMVARVVQPQANTALSDLQSASPERDFRVVGRFDENDPVDRLASEFLQEYPNVYARVRNGAIYRTTNATFERDLKNARGLASAYPDLERLLVIAETFLRSKTIGDKNQPGTPGQLLHMAPEFDGLLKANGR